MANKRDGALIDRSSIPLLNSSKIGFAGLVSCASAPAMGLQEIRCRVQRVGRDVEIAGAVSHDVLGQKLRLANFAVHGASRACRQDAAIDQLQSGIELLGEILRPSAVVRESGDGGQHVLTAALTSEACLHSPDGDQWPRRDAVALLDRRKQRRLGLLE